MWDIVLYSSGSRMGQKGREVNLNAAEALRFVVLFYLFSCFSKDINLLFFQ